MPKYFSVTEHLTGSGHLAWSAAISTGKYEFARKSPDSFRQKDPPKLLIPIKLSDEPSAYISCIESREWKTDDPVRFAHRPNSGNPP